MSERQAKPADPGTSIESLSRRGEDIAKDDDEAGRENTGTQSPPERPTGTSTARDYTGVDPQEPIDGGSPAG